MICPNCKDEILSDNIWECQECCCGGHGACFTTTDDADVMCKKCRESIVNKGPQDHK